LYILNDDATLRIYVKGFGCSTSLADAEVLAGCLSRAGHTITGDLEDAEIIVYNTCAVKAPTENRMISLLKTISRSKKLIVAGCLPLVNFERLRKETRFDGAVGPAVGEKIVDVVERVSAGIHVEDFDGVSESMPQLDLPRVRINPRVGIIPVSYGCLGSCAYCCVRFARGGLRSYGIEEIVRKVESDVSEGVREFWLTSQDTACYGKDSGGDLASLIENVCGIHGDFLVRVGMMTPDNLLQILDRVVEAFRDEKVFKFLHLPVQSGDDEVLRRMNRGYSVEDFMMIVEKFRQAFPELTFATDVIVGFPGETEVSFNHSLKLIAEVKPDIVNVSKFFARPGTLAISMKPEVSPSEIKRRSASLASLARRIALERNCGWKGWRGRMIVDEVGKMGSVVGRNFVYKPIAVRDPEGLGLLGRFVSVEVVDAFPSHLVGEIVHPSVNF
jgi:MiaB-like tRNA modifying enzyme